MSHRIPDYSSDYTESRNGIIRRSAQFCSTQHLLFDTPNAPSSVFEEHYIPALLMVLGVRHPWSFASRTAKLVAIPGDENKNLYAVPSDCVHIHAIGSKDCCGNIEEHGWRMERTHIHVCCGCANIHYNYFNPNISDWSRTCEDAVTALVYGLAKLCIAFILKDIHHNTTIQANAIYERQLATAILNDKSGTQTFKVKRKKSGMRWVY